jgi:hypothetical protein
MAGNEEIRVTKLDSVSRWHWKTWKRCNKREKERKKKKKESFVIPKMHAAVAIQLKASAGGRCTWISGLIYAYVKF